MLSKLTGVIAETGTNISHLAMVVSEGDADAEMLLRTNSEEPLELKEAITKAGFNIFSISKME